MPEHLIKIPTRRSEVTRVQTRNRSLFLASGYIREKNIQLFTFNIIFRAIAILPNAFNENVIFKDSNYHFVMVLWYSGLTSCN